MRLTTYTNWKSLRALDFTKGFEMKKLAEKVFSRKLVAFLTATVALWLGIINQDAWEGIARS